MGILWTGGREKSVVWYELFYERGVSEYRRFLNMGVVCAVEGGGDKSFRGDTVIFDRGLH